MMSNSQIDVCSHPNYSKIISNGSSNCLICYCTRLREISNRNSDESALSTDYKLIFDVIVNENPDCLSFSENSIAVVDTTVDLLRVNSTHLANDILVGTTLLCKKITWDVKKYFVENLGALLHHSFILEQSHINCLLNLLRDDESRDLFISTYGSMILPHVAGAIIDDYHNEDMKIALYGILKLTCHTIEGYSVLHLLIGDILIEAFQVLDYKQSVMPLCENILEFIESVLQHEHAVSSSFRICQGRLLCMALKRMIFHGTSAVQLRVMSILHQLLLTHNKLSNLISFSSWASDGQPGSDSALKMIPAVLLEGEILHVVQELMSTVNAQLFSSILPFLEQLCVSSSTNSLNLNGRLLRVLESTLRLGVLHIHDVDYDKIQLIRLLLIIVKTVGEIPVAVQQQIITYYSLLPDLWNFHYKLISSGMLDYCLDPSLKSILDIFIREKEEFMNSLEKGLRYRTQDMTSIGWAFRVANHIFQNESLYAVIPPKRPIKWTLTSMMPFLQYSLMDFSHFDFLSTILHLDLKSSMIFVEESTADYRTLKDILLNLLFHIQSLYLKVIVRNHQDVIWLTLYELFDFAERREVRQEFGSVDLVHSLVLQPWMEGMVITLMALREPLSTRPCQPWRFTQNCLRFVQKWFDMIDKQLFFPLGNDDFVELMKYTGNLRLNLRLNKIMQPVTNCTLFAQLTKSKYGRPSSIGKLCHAIRVALEDEGVKQDLTMDHQILLTEVKQKLKSLSEKFNLPLTG